MSETPEPDDLSLVAACRAGDPAAWELLVRRYQRLVYSIPRRAGLDEDQAAEVFQHTWVALLTHIQTVQQAERIGAWLATTARRESWRVQRHARLRSNPLHPDDEGELELIDPDPAPDDVLIRVEQRHAVRRAVLALDPRCRDLLTALFYSIEPPAYSVIAAQIGVPEGSIGPTRARCLQKLRRLLEPSRDDEI
jgi:RNA polymerase sigma factor (sigma-70 family)